MKNIPVRTADQKPKKKPARRPLLPYFLVILILLLAMAWVIPLPKVQLQTNYNYKSRPETVSLAWPGYGEAAVAAEGYGVLDTNASQVPVPMASVTKAITALAVMDKKPLTFGNQGPTIPIGPTDIANFNDYYAKGGSVVAVSEGEQLSERQALQAMLLPSANNMADTIARWGFGSMDNYLAYTNKYLKSIGAKNTHVGDASGFSPQSVSTAEDLSVIGLKFMANPVLREIAGQKTADLPVAGKVFNTNWLLGNDGVIGVKTGNTEQAGGCYLFAAKRVIQGQPVTVVGSIMGAPDLNTAINDSQTLIRSVDGGFMMADAAKKGQVIGQYTTKWGNSANVVVAKDVGILNWKTRQVTSSINTVNKSPISKGEIVGSLTAIVWDKKSVSGLVAADTMNSPGWQWRLYKRYLGG
jgi:D-alanyl-D-alanine carboxypeptidase (penicillin-binding protein 5/6)